LLPQFVGKLENLSADWQSLRGRYPLLGEIPCEFFERLFSEGAARSLMSFLDIDYREPDFARHVSVSRNDSELDESLRERIYRYYEATYVRVEWEIAAVRICCANSGPITGGLDDWRVLSFPAPILSEP